MAREFSKSIDMLELVTQVQTAAAAVVKDLFEVEVSPTQLPVQETRREFEGDFTLVVFSLGKFKLGNPVTIGEKLGQALQERLPFIEKYNVIKGFLNLTLTDQYWLDFLYQYIENPQFFQHTTGAGKTVVVEYCSPNTNKPLHLGHLRNIVLGDALTRILQANGYQAIPTCLFNDRGTNISKSMHAWLQSEDRLTPASAQQKGDKLVGDYYVSYAKQYAREVEQLMAQGKSKAEAEHEAPSNQAIRELTIKWEKNDPEVRALWEQMNGWVYTAMKDTFAQLGVSFDKFYYESAIYLQGKETVAQGLKAGVFFEKEDGSIWIDLTEEGLDQKLVLRSDGTSVYITQDLAIADAKEADYHMDNSIYVVGNEQEYHFKVLFHILKKLGKPYADGLFHLSYGMVDLPSGKMKSREGTTVEADDLIAEMTETAREVTQELGKTEGMTEEELQQLYHLIAMSALKYFLVKVDPKKRMLFNPAESVDIHGHSGPFIQSSYTRTASIFRKGTDVSPFQPQHPLEDSLHEHERILLRKLMQYPAILAESAATYNPSMIANYAYELAKEYNRFYQGDKIIQSEKPHTSSFRFALSTFTGKALKEALGLLGIDMPERM